MSAAIEFAGILRSELDVRKWNSNAKFEPEVVVLIPVTIPENPLVSAVPNPVIVF